MRFVDTYRLRQAASRDPQTFNMWLVSDPLFLLKGGKL